MGLGKYLAEDVNAGEMLAKGWCKVLGCDKHEFFLPFDQGKKWNNKGILFVRPGGFGDLLFLTPTFAEIKRRWPHSKIFVACFDRFTGALLENANVDGFVGYPVEVEEFMSFDAHIWLENILENNPDARDKHAVDVIAERVGITFEDKTMRYSVTKTERNKADLEFPRWPDRPIRVGVQMSASGSCRTYPFIGDLAVRLWREGYELFLFGKPGEMKTDEPEGIVNVMMRHKSFRESCAILSTCDVVVAPDSALAHIAGALDIPCVALYGPFPWKTRTAYAPKTFALQGMCPVSPCFYHARGGSGPFPEHGPCFLTGRCEALAAIPVDRVIREVVKMLEK